jgi:serine/threonine protein kinase
VSDTEQRLVAGRYRLVSLLGQGGMGRVWLARDETLRRDVAIKELMPPAGLTDDERRELRERSMREARAIARLDQINVVRIFDVLHADGEPWIVMEFVPSRSLHRMLAGSGPLAPAQVARIGLALLAALRAAHRAGLLHRDVKPANVLLADDGRVVLTDFGLATAPDDPSMTQTGIVLGTPSYIAPERLTDGVIGPAADLWSLGATLYAAVEGQPPYNRSSSIATMTAIATDPPRPPERAGALTPALAGLLRKDPKQRISADEAERLLRQALTDQPTPAPARAAASVTPTGASEETVPQEEPAPKSSAAPAPPDQPARTLTATTGTATTRRKGWLTAAAVAAVALAGVIAVQPLIGNALSDDAKPDFTLGASTSPTDSPMVGWRYYTQESGFSVLVRDGWQQLRNGTRVEFHELESRTLLAVDALGKPAADLLANARAAEAAARRTGRYPDYKPVHLREVDYRARAVDREWTYLHAGGTRMQASSRTFVAEDGQAYTIDWTTPADAWASGQNTIALILESFRASHGEGSPGEASPSPSSQRSGSPSPSAGVTASRSPKPTTSSTQERARFTNRPIVNNGSGTCIDVPDGSPTTTASMRTWECRGVAGQRFTLAADDTLRALGRCLEATETGNGPHLRIAACTGSAKQRFDLTGGGQLVSLAATPAKCLDVPGGDSGNGAWINLWDCNGSRNQTWRVG